MGLLSNWAIPITTIINNRIMKKQQTIIKFLSTTLLIICSLYVSSQNYKTSDTITLKEVKIKGVKRHKYGVGTIIHNIDSLSKETYSNGNLADLLSNTMPIYIRKQSDSFSTITLRGTSANHTAILVNGINLNSLTLGHSNLGNIDMFLFDYADIQLGSSGAIYGTDAIGGTINLKLDNSLTNGQKLFAKTSHSSLNNHFYGVKYFTGNKKFDSKTRVFYVKNENRFKFKNLANYNFSKKQYPTEYTNNSRKENYGILQQFLYKPSLKNTFNVLAWYQRNWDQIQPSMGNNSNDGTYEKSFDEYIRLLSGYERLGSNYKFKTDIGYMKDKQIHNGNSNESISTERFIANSSLEYSLSTAQINVGINYKYIIPDVYTYPNQLDEHRTDVFFLYKQDIFNKFKYSINLRQSFVSGYKSPFTPSLGLSYTFADEDKVKKVLSLKLAKGYKIPTLNQRFWGTQGNPDIKPEKSKSVELGYNYTRAIGKSILSIILNSYYTDVDNWIMWVNKGEWIPINERKVECIGGEFFSHLKFKINTIEANFRLNYFFSSSILQESETEASNEGKQLAYTPRHNANSNLALSYNDYIFTTDITYTGERHVTGYNKTLDGFYLLNSSISKDFSFNTFILGCRLQVNNLLNKDYQSWEYYAMPGRNYNISLNIKIN